MAKYLDDNGLLYLWGKIKATFANLTEFNALGDRVTTLENSHPDANIIETVKVNGTALTVTNKSVDVPVPTDNADLSNGAGYQTAANVESAITAKNYTTMAAVEAKKYLVAKDISNKADKGTTLSAYGITNAYTKDETNSAIAAEVGKITGISYSIVTSLPASGVAGVIYLIDNSGSGNNIYDEYIYVNKAFEKIGTTEVDLSGYWNNSNLTNLSNTEIDSTIAKA